MKVLAALDLDRTTPDVLREARLWTRRLGAELFLIHVADPDPDFIGYGAGPESVRLAVAHKFTRAHQRIEALATELRKEGFVATTALLIQGATAETMTSPPRTTSPPMCSARAATVRGDRVSKNLGSGMARLRIAAGPEPASG